MNMNKIMLMLNIQSMNALPVMERWLLRTHAPETVSRVGPWLTRYQSYRAVPPPPKMHRDAEAYGYYNWRITELWTAEIRASSVWYSSPGILSGICGHSGFADRCCRRRNLAK
ncbi:MAG: hypothetical protein R3C40_00290 [Parvularculaceae bacterium]